MENAGSNSVHQLRPKKSLGQNFLMHARIAERIALVAGLTLESVVFEIGPGTGMLTRELLKKAGSVIALEADAALFERLKCDFASEIADGRLTLLYGDIRTFDLAQLPEGYVLVANIPYYLTGDIFRQFLTAENQPRSMTLLVQKEVAERIARSQKESILSLSVKVYGIPKYEFTVPRGAFHPAPKVDSAVVTIREISRARFLAKGGPVSGGRASQSDETYFFNLIHAGFAHKRKYVRKNLSDAGFDPGTIPEKARAEDVPLEVWLSLREAKNRPVE